jgi:hypothetical protein
LREAADEIARFIGTRPIVPFLLQAVTSKLFGFLVKCDAL